MPKSKKPKSPTPEEIDQMLDLCAMFPNNLHLRRMGNELWATWDMTRKAYDACLREWKRDNSIKQ